MSILQRAKAAKARGWNTSLNDIWGTVCAMSICL